MASSRPPSSTSSFNPSSHYSTRSSRSSTPAMPNKSPSKKDTSRPAQASTVERESSVVTDCTEDYEVEVTTVVTTTTRTRRSVTPQPQSPRPVASAYLSTLLRQSVSRNQSFPSSPGYKAESSASPSPAHVSGSPSELDKVLTPRRSPSQHGSIIFGRIRYAIPHPNEIVPSPYVHPPPKKWYTVTVGQDVGVFDDWLLVKELTDCVPSARFRGFKTFQAALTHYTRKYHKTGGVIRSPIAGSRWDDPIPDWDDQPFEWDDEMEDAVNSIQEQHARERRGGASHT
ncbi:hypothetical protein ARMSODRAFT_1023746 [Armillaria solidipes]|uniref:Ribonuclease H1 N-terminal domain-containing protein n=1 Tax=Armillaria solidipes TaxID=1076256 RepID=A0A2H3AYX5_9AGAR|nr:hypothetical protein ARMSODRAFT_1023746 [Armillaria solidipes]